MDKLFYKPLFFIRKSHLCGLRLFGTNEPSKSKKRNLSITYKTASLLWEAAPNSLYAFLLRRCCIYACALFSSVSSNGDSG